MSAQAPATIGVPNINIINIGIEKLENQAEAYQKSAKQLSIYDKYNFDPSFGEFAPTRSILDKFDRSLINKRNELTVNKVGLEQERFNRKVKLQKEILKLYLKAIKDGILTEKEKKEILKKLKDYKAIVNFLSFNYSSKKESNPATLDSVVNQSSISLMRLSINETDSNELKSRMKEAFELMYEKIELNNMERDNKATEDDKISADEVEDQSYYKAELGEIKEVGQKILEIL